MAVFGGILLTNNGRNLLAKAQTGKVLKFTKVILGDGELGTTESITNISQLKNEILICDIIKMQVLQKKKATITFILNNQELTEGFYWREIGLMAEDPDTNEEVLYCYGNARNNGEYISEKNGTDILEKHINIDIIISNVENVSAKIDESLIFITEKQLDKKISETSKNTQEWISNITKMYKGTNIVAETIEGVGKIHKLYGKPEGVGTTGAIEIISTKADSTSLKTITCKPLYCIKNNIGNIIAQDYIDFDRQKIVRQCGYITFDGSNDEDWVADTRNNRFFIAKPVDCLRSELDNITSICNKYELDNTETVDESYNIGASIYVKDLSCSDLASFKQSLASNPMILIVALNTSYEEDIDCTCGITQYEGETTIYNTEGAELEVELTNNKAICSANESIVNLQKEKISKPKNKIFKVNIDSTYIGKAELNQVIRNGNVCRVDLRCEIIADIPNSTTFATLPFLPELSITFMLGLGGHYTINTPKWGFAGTNGEIQSNPITKGQYMHIAFTYICKD